MLKRRAAAVTAAAALLAVVCGVRVAQLRIETDWTRLFPYPNEEFLEALRMIGHLSSSAGMTFVFERTDDSALDEAESLEPIAEHLRDSGLFHEVLLRFDAAGGVLAPSWVPAFLDDPGMDDFLERLTPEGARAAVAENMRLLFTPAGGMLGPLLERDPLRISWLAGAGLSLKTGYGLQDGYMVSSDERRLLVIAVPKNEASDSTWMARLATSMRAVRREAAAAGWRARMPGSLFLRAELFESVRRDLLKTGATSLLSIVLAFLVIYRGSWRAVLCILLPVLWALGLTFGLYTLASSSIDLISALSAVMLIGLGVDYGIHLLARYREEEGPIEERLAAALRTTGRGIVSGALTTAVAFFSILITGMKSFYTLGLTAGVGMLLALAASFLLFPLCVLLLRPFPQGGGAIRAHRFAPAWYRLATRAALPLTVALLAALPVFVMRARFEGDFRLFLPAHSEVLRDMQAMEGGAEEGAADGLVLRFPSRGYAADSGLAARLEAAAPQAHWRTAFSILPAASALDRHRAQAREAVAQRGLSPSATLAAVRAALREQGMREPPGLDAYVQELYDALTPGLWEKALYALPLAAPYFSEDGRELYALASLPGGAAWTGRDVDRLLAAAKRDGVDGVALSGGLLVERLRTRVVADSLKAAGVSMLLVFAILWHHLRRPGLALLVLVPLGFGLLLTCAAMGVANLSFNFFNLTVLPLIFGLGIDDGVHFMQTFRETGSTRAAFHRTGGPIFYTTLTTCLGFGSLMAVSFKGVFYMGLFVTMGLVACLVATVTILPVFTRRLEKGRSPDAP